jgi:hypothetical protein
MQLWKLGYCESFISCWRDIEARRGLSHAQYHDSMEPFAKIQSYLRISRESHPSIQGDCRQKCVAIPYQQQ